LFCRTEKRRYRKKTCRLSALLRGQGVAALMDVYSHYGRMFSFFYLGSKLIFRERVGAKIKKTYDKPQPPFARDISSSERPEEIKERLKSMKKQLSLMSEMKKMQSALGRLPSFTELVHSSFSNQI
jgi:hypothetical protein